MAKSLTFLMMAYVGVTLVAAGSFQFPWERDQENRENSYHEQNEPIVDKHENPKDFIGSMMRRIFGKSEDPDQPHMRPAREAVGPIQIRPAREAVDQMLATPKTTKRPTTTRRTTTVKTTTRKQVSTTRKQVSTTRNPNGSSAVETSTIVPLVMAFSAVYLQWFHL